jgi:hypothetical protein
MSVPGCPRCSAPLAMDRDSGRVVSVGRIELAVPPRLLASCPRRHRVDPAAAVRRSARGLVRARWRPGADRCGACPTRLTLPERRGRRALTVEPVGAPPYTLELVLPLRRCPDCAVENVPASDRRALSRALRGAARTTAAA